MGWIHRSTGLKINTHDLVRIWFLPLDTPNGCLLWPPLDLFYFWFWIRLTLVSVTNVQRPKPYMFPACKIVLYFNEENLYKYLYISYQLLIFFFTQFEWSFLSMSLYCQVQVYGLELNYQTVFLGNVLDVVEIWLVINYCLKCWRKMLFVYLFEIHVILIMNLLNFAIKLK